MHEYDAQPVGVPMSSTGADLRPRIAAPLGLETRTVPVTLASVSAGERVRTDGRFLALGQDVFRVRGTTYGSFAPRCDGELFPEPADVERDFAVISARGLNVVRTYTLPPPDVFELAEAYNLRLLVGLHHHDWQLEPIPGRAARARVREAGRQAVCVALQRCADSSTVLAIAVGNEIPVDVVRLHGITAVTDALSELIAELGAADPDLPTTYVNFPTTEFLAPEGQDLVCFNVFLEQPAQLRTYLRHLRTLAGDHPVVITELGLAAGVHGEQVQSTSLEWQLRLVDETGCCGATVFAWTDEWAVGGRAVEGWGFGVTDVARRPKPALRTLERWARSGLTELRPAWPRVSVVVCARNEERRIADCLTSLQRCPYPGLEVVVCDDGSTDATAEIASRFPFPVLRLPHGGLSAARNVGLRSTTGEIVAYLDADASCHTEWPFHLALSFDGPQIAGTGGPNLPPPGAGWVQRAVALAPGAPMEVLVGDDRAEHVAGCNFAFRREALEAIGGFDPAYVAAGDDVDVCWKLLDAGHEIAFAPGAQVLHHRRDDVAGYLRQQRGYGKAERMLSGAHPHRFNTLGQARWTGFIYGGATFLPRLVRPVVYHGYLGQAPFQPVLRRRAEHAALRVGAMLPLVLPAALAAAVLATVAFVWLALLGAVLAVPVLYAAAIGAAVRLPRSEPHPARVRVLVAALHVLQPYWRAWGRLRGQPLAPHTAPRREWHGDRETWMRTLRRDLEGARCRVRVAAPSSCWDMTVTVGVLLRARLTTAVLWHWRPGYAFALRPHPCLLMILTVTAVLALLAPMAAALLLLGCTVFGLVEAYVLRGRLRGALNQSTAGVTIEETS